MYVLSYPGAFHLLDGYNPAISRYDWVSEQMRMPILERQRILNRLDSVLKVIEFMATRNGHDSLLYKSDQFQ
jgi:hypothetical protein